MNELTFRQIHLDFHTTRFIPDVGADFDAEEFADTLQKAHVTSINMFAKCLHGLSYYPTKVGKVHPSLQRDLMGEMIAALHRRGIKCPVYYSIGWSEWDATHHADWVQVDSSGRMIRQAPFGDRENQWRNMCFNTPYMEKVRAQIGEILDNYEVDGFWFDILFYDEDGCCCNHCVNDLLEQGRDPADVEVRRDFTVEVIGRETRRIYELVKSKQPDASVFFNCRQRLDAIEKRSPRRELANATHIEIESLPSGFWGFNHFPMYVRYFRNLGQQVIGMNGKFHLEWGDFGGFKTKEGLEYECFRMLAEGAKLSVGDQLHPRGRLDPVTYELIGGVFGQVAEKEAWCSAVEPISDIAIMMVNDDNSAYETCCRPKVDTLEAAMQTLLEDHRQFEIVDWESDLTPYRLLVLPDIVTLSDAQAAVLAAYRAQGGKLLLTGKSGLREDLSGFALPVGVEDCGESAFRQSYIRTDAAVWPEIPVTNYISYLAQRNVRAAAGARPLAKVVNPYFNRDWLRFSSHMQCPPDTASDSGFDAIVRSQDAVYAAAPLFTLYKQYGNHIYKRLVSKCLDELLGDRLIATSLPSTAELTYMRQPGENRNILHLLHYPVQKRSKIYTVEDVIPLYGVRVELRAERPRSLYLAPQGEELDYRYADGVLRFAVPEVNGHQMVVLQY